DHTAFERKPQGGGGSRGEEREADEWGQEPRREPAEEARRREGEPAPDDDRPPVAGVSKHAEQRLDRCGDEARQRQEQTDRGVRETEVGADQRPGRLAYAEDELVQQLDRQQYGDDAGRYRKIPVETSVGRVEFH